MIVDHEPLIKKNEVTMQVKLKLSLKYHLLIEFHLGMQEQELRFSTSIISSNTLRNIYASPICFFHRTSLVNTKTLL